jgi:hypothetical protein
MTAVVARDCLIDLNGLVIAIGVFIVIGVRVCVTGSTSRSVTFTIAESTVSCVKIWLLETTKILSRMTEDLFTFAVLGRVEKLLDEDLFPRSLIEYWLEGNSLG